MDKPEKDQITTPEQKALSASEQFEVDLKEIDTTIEALLTDENASPEAIKQAWNARADITEAYIDSLESTEQNPKQREIAQFDVMVDKARIFEKTGNTLKFLEELDCAENFALNEYLDDYVDINTITDLINEKVSEFKAIDPNVEIDKFLYETDPSDELNKFLRETVLKLREYSSFDDREYLRDKINNKEDSATIIDDIYGVVNDENIRRIEENERIRAEKEAGEDNDEQELEEIDPDEVMISLGLLE